MKNASQPDHNRADPQKLTVFAAGSLSQAFKKVADAFRVDHGIVLDIEYGSTARMAKLIQDGAACDVFAAADMETPQHFVAPGRAQSVIPFVRNDIVAVARKGAGITSQNLNAFLTSPRCTAIGISDPATQPCGANAVKALSNALPLDVLNGKIQIVTGGLDKKKEKAPGEKSDYTIALEKQTDLLVVFRTTAHRVCAQLNDADIIELPAPMHVTAQYGLAVLNGKPAAHDFAGYLQTEKVRRIFAGLGFQ